MTVKPELLVAAGKSAFEAWGGAKVASGKPWEEQSDLLRQAFIDEAKAAIDTAYPELVATISELRAAAGKALSPEEAASLGGEYLSAEGQLRAQLDAAQATISELVGFIRERVASRLFDPCGIGKCELSREDINDAQVLITKHGDAKWGA